MSETARKMFDISEQLAEDLIRTIEVISPVITVIREWGKCEQEYRKAKDQSENLKEQLESFRKTISFLCEDDPTRKALEAKYEVLQQAAEAYKQKAKSLDEANRQYEQEVVDYMAYSRILNVNEKIWNKVLESMKVDNDNALCILFILHTGRTDTREKNKILKQYFKDYPVDLTIDWNRFLDFVKN